MPTIIATTMRNELSKLSKIISSPSYTAATAVGQPISGAESFPRRSCHSTCSEHRASTLSYQHTTNCLATLISTEPQWLPLEPSVSFSKKSSSVSAPGPTMANTDGTLDLPPSITVTITFMSTQQKQPAILTLSLFFLQNSICQLPQLQTEQLPQSKTLSTS